MSHFKNSSAPPPAPTLFLYKPTVAFLRANLSHLIRNSVLTTPSGLLLAHASSLPASALRRQCAVAASLWVKYTSTPNNLDGSSGGARSGGPSKDAVTVQLENGTVFVIRRLACGMKLICMGGPDEHTTQPGPASTRGSSTGASTATQETHDTDGSATDFPTPGATTQSTEPLASPSEAASVHSAATVGATTIGSSSAGTGATARLSQAEVRMMRLQVEEIARALDAKLAGLQVPEMGIGATAAH